MPDPSLTNLVDPQRWMLYRLADFDWHLGEPTPATRDHPQCERVEVMPVAEHEAEVERLRAALRDLAGDYGCTVVEPPDESLPAQGEPCRERRPDDPDTWCYACVASEALHPSDPLACPPASEEQG